MKEIYLVIDFSTFELRVNASIDKLKSFKEGIRQYSNGEQLVREKKTVISEVLKDIGECFNEPHNYFLSKFKQASTRTYSVPMVRSSLARLLVSCDNELRDKILQLQSMVKIINHCEKVKDYSFSGNENLTIREKQKFILKTLHALSDNKRYDIAVLFAGNGIQERRKGEFEDIGMDLTKRGVIDSSFTANGFFAKLTLAGEKYVEDILLKEIALSKQKSSIHQELIENQIDKLKKLLRREGFKFVLEELDKAICSKIRSNDLTKIWGRYSRLERKKRDGVISREDISLEENRISSAIMNLIEVLGNSDLRQSDSSMNSE